MQRLASALAAAMLLLTPPAARAEVPRPPADKVLQLTDVWLPKIDMLVFFEKSTAGRVKNTGYIWIAWLDPDPREGALWLHTIVDCKALKLVWDVVLTGDLAGNTYDARPYPEGKAMREAVWEYEEAAIEQACLPGALPISEDFSMIDAAQYTMKHKGDPQK